MKLLETNPLRCEAIDVWGFYSFGSVTADVSVTEVIRKDNDDVWVSGGAGCAEREGRC